VFRWSPSRLSIPARQFEAAMPFEMRYGKREQGAGARIADNREQPKASPPAVRDSAIKRSENRIQVPHLQYHSDSGAIVFRCRLL
jgi:hypothetical protein